MADALISDLKALGLDVEEDDTAAQTGVRLGQRARAHPGSEGAPTVLLCAHMDTVPLDGPVEVVSDNGLLTNRHDAILGADNKAAVVTIMATVRRLVRDGTPPTGVELLFTTGEEQALKGAKAFDMSRLRPTSATSSTTPLRSARSCSRRRPTTRSRPASAGRPRTPASARRRATTRSRRPRGRSRRCGSAAWTTRPPPTWAASRAAPRRTWSPSAATWSWRRAASTPSGGRGR